MRLLIRGIERNTHLPHRKQTYFSVGEDQSSDDDGCVYAAKERIGGRERHERVGDWNRWREIGDDLGPNNFDKWAE